MAKRRAEYGNRTRLPGLGSPCTTDVLIPHALALNPALRPHQDDSSKQSRYPDSNRGPTHYECVALPTEPYRRFSGAKILLFLRTSKQLRINILRFPRQCLCPQGAGHRRYLRMGMPGRQRYPGYMKEYLLMVIFGKSPRFFATSSDFCCYLCLVNITNR